jgi:putative acetyltransferase
MMNQIKLRRANQDDLNSICELFFNTVTSINANDYDENQIRAWSEGAKNIEIFKEKIEEQHFIVAIMNDTIVGFSSVDDTGYIDFMYIHKNYQRHGIAKSLLTEIERIAKTLGIKELNSSVSITARGFFEKFGFVKIREESVESRGAVFINTIFLKKLK